MTDMLSFVDLRVMEALNAKPDKGLENALKQGYREDDGLVLESDTDEQLLIHLTFNQSVRLSGLVIKSSAGGQAPKIVKLFVNQPTIGFSEATESPGVDSFDLTEAQLTGEVVPLRLVKFNRVNCLTIFVESNQGDEDTTIIQKIAIQGSAGETFDVKDFKDVSKQDD
ncbi:hypothetical protein Ndes2526B_g04093 [Nannochloris sp. 'desiccata']